jgi:serine/threonine protein kinase
MLSSENGFTEAIDDGSCDWKGTERYDLVGRLGRGGMGVVYEAFDKERGQSVAVKTLLHFSPAALYQFKQEFRTLADVRHDNLVRFYEFVLEDGGNVFFTMELVRGVDFLKYVQSDARRSSKTAPTLRLEVVGGELSPGVDIRRANATSPSSKRATPADIERLRAALRQLVDGTCVLHAAGKLHRDIKPSNVLVTSEGRVVLLDFGVAAELGSRPQDVATPSEGIVGTARYIAPEQAEEAPLSPASDWYSVGVMLYEALVGRPPFEGSVMEVLTLKNTLEPPRPSECVTGVPADLDDLCVSLLRCDPNLRPSGAEIMRRLGVVRSSPRPPRPTIADGQEIIGRESQLGALREAFEATRAGQSMTVRVSGAPGMGKSAVVRHFLDSLEVRGEARVLRGRAYEREAVPYKGVDSLIDALTHLLVGAAEAGSIVDIPADAWALARLFPVLRHVPGIGDPPDGEIGDPQDVRRRAIESLRAIFASLARRQPVVVFLDDAQWADVDSAILVASLMKAPHAPPLLFLMTFREGEEATSPFLAELARRWPKQAAVRELKVGPLSDHEGVQLALCLLDAPGHVAQRVAEGVSREARGSPFLIEELARSNQGQASPSGSTLAVLTLEQMVGERLDRLSAGARSVMEMVAIEGRPVQVALLAQAAGIDAIDSAFTVLAARRFVQTGLRGGQEVVESVHARIRETIVAQLPEARLRQHHLRLAQALEHLSSGDAEAIAVHWLGAGNGVRAAHFAETAAEQAALTLAFDRAARLIQFALGHVPAGEQDASRLQKRLAEVLQWAGRHQEAARAYIRAAHGAAATESVELHRAAAEQLLLSGHIAEGTERLHGVLDAAGMHAPRSPLAAVFWFIIYSLWLKVIGLRFKERAADTVSPTDKLRVDALFTVAMGFALVDTILGACMQARHMVEALRVGEPLRVARATVLEAAHLAATGKPPTLRERRLIEIAQTLTRRLARPESDAYFNGIRGISMFHRGEWALANEFFERAEKAPHEYAGASFNRVYHVYSYAMRGDLKGTVKRMELLMQRARDRGELYTTANLGTTLLLTAALAADDLEGARRGLREALADWPQDRFLVPHYQAMVFGADIDLYAGEVAQAYDRFVERLPALKKSQFLYSGMVRTMSRAARGRLAVAAIAARPERRSQYIAEARLMAKLLEGETDPWVGTVAAVMRATVENAAGHRDVAIASLRLAIERMERTDTRVGLPVARYRLGQLLGGSEKRQVLETAMAELAAQGVVNPSRFADVSLPGTWDSST